MFEKVLIFGAGTLLGAYMMRNHIFRKAALSIIGSDEETDKKETESSKTEKES
jgi:hypothetical protein